MSAVAAVVTAMASRNTNKFQKFSDKVVMRDDGPFYFGDEGDVCAKYNSSRGCLEIDGQGNGVDIKSPLVKDRVQLIEKFEKLPQLIATVGYAVNNQFEVLGTNSSDGDVTMSPEGGIIMETDGAAADSIIVLPALTANLSAWSNLTWGTDRSVRWEAVIATGSTAQSVTSTMLWAGLKLTNTGTVATDAEQAFFSYSSIGGAFWTYVYSIGGVDVQATTGVAIAQNTTYHLVIDIDSTRVARFYINGVLVATSTALTAGDLIPYIGVLCEATAALARRVYVFQTSISRTIANA